MEWKEIIGDNKVTLGPYNSYQLVNTPRRMLFSLSHYKFAAKLFGSGKSVLEVGCSEGFGTHLLAEFASNVVAIDIDKDAIEEANKSFARNNLSFLHRDIVGEKIALFDGVVSFDVVEHIEKENEDDFYRALCQNLNEYGVCIIGTPNETSDQYSSPASREGHVNLYTWDRLKSKMDEFFHQVFIFSANDEIIHTGFYPLAHYLIAVGVCKKI